MSKIFMRSKIAVFSSLLAVVLATMSATSVFAAPSGPKTIWGNQYRELQADRAFFSKLKSHTAEINRSSTPAQIQQYLNQYAFALNQAETIVLHNSSSSVPNVNHHIGNNEKTLQGQLAIYLHMMRGLRTKLGG
jgi:hypothetical protein